MPTTKQQPGGKKQFSARSHARSASYGRNLNKLGRITSIEEIHQRPALNRSKSTDGTLGRKNRSYTKLSALQPLSRTRSHQSVQRGNGKAVLELHKEEDSSDDENNDTDKNNDKSDDEDEVDEVEEFSDEETTAPKPNEPTQVQLSYKAPPQFSHNSIPKNSSFSSEPVENQHVKQKESVEGSVKLDATRLESEASKLNLNDINDKIDNTNTHSKDNQGVDQYKESLSQYYQNMILSQSTGVVRAFGDQPFMNSLVHDQINQGNLKEGALQYIHSNDHISGTLANLKSTSSSTNSLRQFTMHHPNQHHSSNESSSMSSYKAKEPSGVSFASRTPRESMNGTPNNFSQFLKTNNSNIETRTQQKLWLQRENSLLDLPSASGNNSNNPQLRRDFERVSREFVNVRRFANPCLESVKRVSTTQKTSKPQASGFPSMTSTANIKQVKSNDFQAKVFKLWISGESSGGRRPHQSSMGIHYQQQRPPLLQTSSSSYSGVSQSLRSPVAPTTRAVDRANNSPENKRIDLAAIRMPEEHVQKLS